MVSEGDVLRKQKKLYAALEKCNEALELGTEKLDEIVKMLDWRGEALTIEQKKQEVQKEIIAFEEKQSYIKHVELKEFRVGKRSRFGFGEPEPAIFGKVVNHGNKTLREIEVTVYFLGKDGKPISEKTYHPVLVTEFWFGDDNKPLKPGYIEKFQYSVPSDLPSEWSGKARAEITNIKF